MLSMALTSVVYPLVMFIDCINDYQNPTTQSPALMANKRLATGAEQSLLVDPRNLSQEPAR